MAAQNHGKYIGVGVECAGKTSYTNYTKSTQLILSQQFLHDICMRDVIGKTIVQGVGLLICIVFAS